MAGGSDGIDDDGGFLTLEFIDGSDSAHRECDPEVSKTCALYGAIIRMSSSPIIRSVPLRSVHVAFERRTSRRGL